MPFCSYLNMTPLRQTLPIALETSRKRPYNLITAVKRFVNVMSYGQNLIYIGISSFKTRRIRKN